MAKYAVVCNITNDWVFFNDIQPRLKNIGEYDLYINTTIKNDKISKLNAVKTSFSDSVEGFMGCFEKMADKQYSAVLIADTNDRIIDRKDALACCIPTTFKAAIEPKLDANFGLFGLSRLNYALTNSADYNEDQKNKLFYDDKAALIGACKSIRCKTLCYDYFCLPIEWINFDVIKSFFINKQLKCSLSVFCKLFGCACVAAGKKIKSANITKKYEPTAFESEYQAFVAELKNRKK